MTISDRTLAVIRAWAKLAADPQPEQPLQALGANLQELFYPDACQSLVRRLITAFPEDKHLSKDVQYTQICDSQNNSTGTIVTVKDLIRAVESSVTTPIQKFMSFVSAPFRFVARKVRGK